MQKNINRDFLVALLLFSLLGFIAYLQIKNVSDNNSPQIQKNDKLQGTATVISAKPRDKVFPYTVQKDETLPIIAKKFGISVNTIKWANNINADTISAGTILKISPVTGIVHIVEKGETVESIANKYNSSIEEIANYPFNQFEDDEMHTLTPGQTLIVPNGIILK